MNHLLFYLDLLGVATFAVTGALVACRCRMDLFGVVFVASVTALGGGTIRDLLLDRTVVWIDQPLYIGVTVLSGGFAFIANKLIDEKQIALIFLDAIGLATFTVIGVSVAHEQGLAWPVAMLLGMISAVAGGMIRDLLCQDCPLILRKEIYATASLVGGLTFIAGVGTGLPEPWIVAVAMLVTLSIRMLAVRYRLSLPAHNT